MTRHSWPFTLGAMLVIAGACQEQALSPGASEAAPAADLALTLPQLHPSLFIAHETDGKAPPSGDAALMDARDDIDLEDIEDIRSGIYSAKTVVGFRDGRAFARGDHWYTGNKSRVETHANVTRGGAAVGSQTAVSEGYNMFLLDLGRSKHLEATANVFTDRNCELTVGGDSEHSAWWEFWTGMAVSTWGKTVRSTAASPRTGGECEEPDHHVSSGDDGTYSCYYLLTYDLHSGQILDAQFLFCDSTYI